MFSKEALIHFLEAGDLLLSEFGRHFGLMCWGLGSASCSTVQTEVMHDERGKGLSP